MTNKYKSQYKSNAGQQWQTNTNGSEMGCMQSYQRLKEKYPFARVIDGKGNVIAS